MSRFTTRDSIHSSPYFSSSTTLIILVRDSLLRRNKQHTGIRITYTDQQVYLVDRTSFDKALLGLFSLIPELCGYPSFSTLERSLYQLLEFALAHWRTLISSDLHGAID